MGSTGGQAASGTVLNRRGDDAGFTFRVLSAQGQRITTALAAAQTCDVNHLAKSV